MPRRSVIVSTVTCLIVLIIACSAFAQERGQGQRGAAPPTRAPLFLKEEWKQTPAGGEHPQRQPQRHPAADERPLAPDGRQPSV